MWMSSPHFFNSPDYIREDFEGIDEPSAELHETQIDVEPTSGVAISLHKKIQVMITGLKGTKIWNMPLAGHSAQGLVFRC